MSYYFAEFGPNTTTFVLSAECYPTSARTTGHGISAGVAKLGAFIGVYLFPHISKEIGIGGALELSAGRWSSRRGWRWSAWRSPC